VHLAKYKHVLLVTGGGLGAQSLNTAVIENAPELLRRYPGMVIVHLSGRQNEADVLAAYDEALPAEMRSRVIVKGFAADMYRYSGAADVVIARAGATNLAELAVQAKPCIIVPAEQLTGGHQLKNAVALKKQGAIIEMTEDQIAQELRLASVVSDLLDHPAKRAELSLQFVNFGRPDAARKIAEILLVRALQAHRLDHSVDDSDSEAAA
jgi:UDP-N-acetylglucosamine--N-acetylmuramyl-(pentapeptide) pyrophosphoryl-undecaprenol N-acetylglucosamine transferase